MKIKKGNNIPVQIKIQDSSGNPILNLATAADVIWTLKNNKTDSNANAVLSKSVVATNLTVDSPIVGSVAFTISAAESAALDKDRYYMALQVNYPASDLQEGSLKVADNYFDTLDVVQDIIR